jgi:thymidine phosphorylase
LKHARDLAESIVRIAIGAGLPTTALVTDMDEVLGTTAGNALEVGEAVDYLTGRVREPRLHGITLALAGEMLALGKLAASPKEGRGKAQAALDSGAAAEKFTKMVAALGGPKDFVERSEAYLVRAPVTLPFTASRSGVISGMNAREVGVAVVDLGGGRRKTTDKIDLAVGFSDCLTVGARVAAGDRIALVHAADDAAAKRAVAALERSVRIEDAAPAPRPLVLERIAAP